MPKFRHVLALVAVLAVAVLVAWAADSYFGQRRAGQEVILSDQLAVVSYSAFTWEMDSPAEVILNERITSYAVANGTLRFTAVPDTYIYLNTAGRTLSADFNFFFELAGRARRPGSFSIFLLQGPVGSRTSYGSEPIFFEEGQIRKRIDLETLRFDIAATPEREELRWGIDFLWADGLRLDFDSLEGTEVEIHSAAFAPGVRLDLKFADIWPRCSATEGLELGPDGAVRLNPQVESAVMTTCPIGVGTVEGLLDVCLDRAAAADLQIRTGEPAQDGIDWGRWSAAASDGSLADHPPGRYIQARITLRRQEEQIKYPGSLRLRVLDSAPPGLAGPMLGTALLAGAPVDPADLPEPSAAPSGLWLRLPLSRPDFDAAVDELTARDLNIVASVDLSSCPPGRTLAAIARHRARIAVWEVLNAGRLGASQLADFYIEARQSNPRAVIFPERLGPDYLQRLARDGYYAFATASGTSEEVLDRGFWLYLVLAVIGLLLIIGLGPQIGYNFRLGPDELAAGGVGLLACALILIPAILLTGLAQLTLPRDLAQIQVALSRYSISAFLQEFIRALMLLLPVTYLIRHKVREEHAWAATLAVSSLLFGLGHLGYPGLSAAEVTSFVLVTTLAGVIFGLVFYRTRSLALLMVVHLVANLFMSTMTTIGPRL